MKYYSGEIFLNRNSGSVFKIHTYSLTKVSEKNKRVIAKYLWKTIDVNY
jgi:hypothetical protein